MDSTDSKNISNGILRAIAIILAIGILLLFLYKISDVLVYIAIAGVISLIVEKLYASEASENFLGFLL